MYFVHSMLPSRHSRSRGRPENFEASVQQLRCRTSPPLKERPKRHLVLNRTVPWLRLPSCYSSSSSFSSSIPLSDGCFTVPALLSLCRLWTGGCLVPLLLALNSADVVVVVVAVGWTVGKKAKSSFSILCVWGCVRLPTLASSSSSFVFFLPLLVVVSEPRITTSTADWPPPPGLKATRSVNWPEDSLRPR